MSVQTAVIVVVVVVVVAVALTLTHRQNRVRGHWTGSINSGVRASLGTPT